MELGDFTNQAEAYARARPGYPDELIDDLLNDAGVVRGDRVAEPGAGTGIFTAMLSIRGCVVTAIEPNAAMREKAPPLANVTWQAGTFEATALPDQSVKWVVSAQAFHWADPRRALPELRRVLRPGGTLTVFWNNRLNSESPPLAFTDGLMRGIVPELDPAYRAVDWASVLVSTGDFHTVVERTLRHEQTYTKARYLDLWRSHHRLNHTAGKERVSQFLYELERWLTEHAFNEVVIPYICRSWSVTATE